MNDLVPYPIRRLGVKQDRIRDVAVTPRGVVALSSLLRNLVLEAGATVNAVHQQLEVMSGGGITVQVNGTGVFQHPAHFEQPNRHHAQVGLHPLAVGQSCRLQHLVHGRLLVGNQSHPGDVQVGQCPSVLEGGAGRGASHRRGVVAIGVERRVQIDEVHRRGVEAVQYVRVVSGTDGPVGEVGHGWDINGSIQRWQASGMFPLLVGRHAVPR